MADDLLRLREELESKDDKEEQPTWTKKCLSFALILDVIGYAIGLIAVDSVAIELFMRKGWRIWSTALMLFCIISLHIQVRLVHAMYLRNTRHMRPPVPA